MEGEGGGSEEGLHRGGVEDICHSPGYGLSYGLARGNREDSSRGMAPGSQEAG